MGPQQDSSDRHSTGLGDLGVCPSHCIPTEPSFPKPSTYSRAGTDVTLGAGKGRRGERVPASRKWEETTGLLHPVSGHAEGLQWLQESIPDLGQAWNSF